MRRAFLAAVAVVLTLAGLARASDPVGIYALVEKVVLEPKDDKPERAQVWGLFRFAVKNFGDEYTAPFYGYIDYHLAPGKADDTRREWADFKKVAGTGQVVAFASRYGAKGTLHKASEKPDKSDAYPIVDGLHKIEATSGGVAKELRSIPWPVEPTDGRDAPDLPVVLKAHGIADKDRENVRYVFEITNATGDKETSEPVPAGARDNMASWKPKMAVKGGVEYTWRVWAVAGDWKGPAITATFRGKSAG
jgi:hypothetical protein